jgi:hypothetical protein
MIARAGAVLGAALLLAPAALGANPRDIARDLEDGKLDGTYTAQELSQFLGDATVQGYGAPEARVLGREFVRQQPAAVAGAESLPFTGVDLALMTAGGAALLLLGFAVRRLARDHR